MSEPNNHDTRSRNALVLAGTWALSILVIWIGLLGVEHWDFGIFLGRFHILLVHMPIGVLCIALLLEVLGRLPWFPEYGKGVNPLLWLGMMSAMVATAAGFLLMITEREAGINMTIHMWTGLAVVVLSVLTLLFKLNGRGRSYFATLSSTVLMVSITGHYGGSLVHEPDYLVEHAPNILKPLIGEGKEPILVTEGLAGVEKVSLSAVTAAAAPGEAAAVEPPALGDLVIYQDILQPVFDNKCIQCHSAEKIKGGLRMDTFEELVKGGDAGESFLAGEHFTEGEYPESELVFRVTLPADDDEFMPPGDKSPMTPQEIEVLKWWITEGASPVMKVAEAANLDPRMETLLVAVLKGEEAELPSEAGPATWAELPEEERETRLAELQKAATEVGFTSMAVSSEDHRLRISVMNCADQFGDEQMTLLEPVAGNIAWLDLAGSSVTDEGMEVVRHMSGLERLHLENTAVTDAGIAHLSTLTSLNYLNLYGTKVTDALFQYLVDIPHLQKLYLWQTEATPQGKRNYERQVNVEVNLGWDLAPPAPVREETVAAVAPAPTVQKPEAEKPKTPDKKEVAEAGKEVAATPADAKKEQAKAPAKVAQAPAPPAPAVAKEQTIAAVVPAPAAEEPEAEKPKVADKKEEKVAEAEKKVAETPTGTKKEQAKAPAEVAQAPAPPAPALEKDAADTGDKPAGDPEQ